MPKYRLSFRVVSSLRSRDDVSLRSNGTEVCFLFSRKAEGSASVLAEFEVEAPTYEVALNLGSSTIIRPCLDALAYATGTPLLCGECDLLLKDEAGNIRRKGRYKGTQKEPISVPLNTRAVAAAQEILGRRDGPALPLCWLRYSHHRQLVLERFAFVWLAFEELAGDADITTQCPTCHYELKHRGANKEKAWEIFQRANPDTSRAYFNDEIWGRARNSFFHGSTYPSPEFLGRLRNITPQLDRAVTAEIREAYQVTAGDLVPTDQIWLVSIYFEWRTRDPQSAFPDDCPAAKLSELVKTPGPLSDEFSLLNQRDLEGW